jgi:hypothetical protein
MTAPPRLRIAVLMMLGTVAFVTHLDAATCLTLIRIHENRNVDTVEPMLCHPGERVVWVVVNDASEKFTLYFEDFKTRPKGDSYSPIVDDVHKIIVNAGEVEVSKKLRVKPQNKFEGANATLPYGGYEYTIRFEGRNAPKPIDPDLDVTPPPLVVKHGAGRGGAPR